MIFYYIFLAKSLQVRRIAVGGRIKKAGLYDADPLSIPAAVRLPYLTVSSRHVTGRFMLSIVPAALRLPYLTVNSRRVPEDMPVSGSVVSYGALRLYATITDTAPSITSMAYSSITRQGDM